LPLLTIVPTITWPGDEWLPEADRLAVSDARGKCLSFRGAPGVTESMAPVYLEHPVQDARVVLSDEYRVIFKRMQSAEIDSDGKVHNVGYAP
jgi:hypothetical protein